jgi:hypothetical protein
MKRFSIWTNPDTYVVLFLVLLLAFPAFAIFRFHMESATFNRLTGAHTTWWDAAWVELRVQEAPGP